MLISLNFLGSGSIWDLWGVFFFFLALFIYAVRCGPVCGFTLNLLCGYSPSLFWQYSVSKLVQEVVDELYIHIV